ncbi:hypothetical protein SAMN04488104_100122 [Algoriphagus faecimaris]|uniref:Uncharacterized protein n=1 Tax=Algoriphagus faecimaris TaxID=686796 RepID=A0A1G6M5W8_9BACT|nr:DUF5995 family protein [Algoriphagus faecimaris]SDC50821.1 hypothetical protein SAMN04488104_100122 [Algoriphagus faecimaris]
MNPITTLLQRMKEESCQWETAGDRRHIFLQCYTLMSQNMYSAIRANHFKDCIWVSSLLVRFSEYYFDALDLYQANHPQVPRVWKQAHDATKNSETHVLQNLLLGINAHINYDLPLALYDCLENEWPTCDTPQRMLRKNDHELVNRIISASIDEVQDTIIKPIAPSLAIMDKMLGPIDEWLLSKMISAWRSDVWEVSELLLHAESTHDRQEIIRKQETEVFERGEKLIRIF